MVEPDNLVLELLRAIRGDLGKMADWMHTLSVEMTSIRQHLAGIVTIQKHERVTGGAVYGRQAGVFDVVTGN